MINWPVPSYIGEIYTAPNGKSWEWNGYAWDFIGPDYAVGPTGADGATGATGPGVTEVTYSELVSEIGASSLVKGSYYLITDFKTCYDQPDFDYNNNPITSGNYKDSPVEPILVLATSDSTISENAYQPDYPNDQIKYDWTYSSTEVTGGDAYGRISERIDEYNNRTDYDHRNILFKRYRLYKHRPGSPLNGTIELLGDGTVNGTDTKFTDLSVGDVIYIPGSNPSYYEISLITDDVTMTVIGDTISATGTGELFYFTIEESNGYGYFSYKRTNVKTDDYQEYTTFGDAISNDYAKNNNVGNLANNYQNVGSGTFILANNVFLEGPYESNKFGDYCYNNTFGTDNQNNIFGDFCYENVSTNDIDDNIIGHYFNNNVINVNVSSNRIENYFSYNLLFAENSSQFERNQVGDEFYGNTIYSDFSNNTIDYYFQNNTIGDFGNLGAFVFDGNVLGINFQNNVIKNNFQDNVTSVDFTSNVINGDFMSNITSARFADNYIGSGFYQNTLENNFQKNTILDGFYNNKIGSDFSANKLSTNFSDNEIGNYFTSNTAYKFGISYGWGDLSTISTLRTYDTFMIANNSAIGNLIIGKEFVVRVTSISPERYFRFKFNQWTQGGNGGGFQYERTEMDSNGSDIGPTVTFTKRNYTSETDIIIPGVLEITRDNNQGGIYNSAIEPNWDFNISPVDTEWNSVYTTEVSGKNFIDNRIGNNFAQNITGNNFEKNTICNNFDSNFIKSYFKSNIIGNNFYKNSIEDYFGGSEKDEIFGNRIGDNFIENSTSVYFYSNDILNDFTANNVGEFFVNNKIKNYFYYNSISDNFRNNQIGDFFGNSTSSNIIGPNFENNNIGNYFGCDDLLESGGNKIGTVTTITYSSVKGTTSSVSLVSGGSGYSDSTNVSTTGGTGSGLTVDIVTDGLGLILSISINNPGTYYSVSDTITISAGGNDATFTISSVNTFSVGDIIDNGLGSTAEVSFDGGTYLEVIVQIGQILVSEDIDNGNGIKANVTDITTDFGADASFNNNFIGNYFINNTIGTGFKENRIGNYFGNKGTDGISNIILDDFRGNVIENYFGIDTETPSLLEGGNIIRSNFIENQIGDSFTYNVTVDTSGGGYYNNVIGWGFNNNTFGDGFNYNRIGDLFQYNTLGTYFASNKIDFLFSTNIIADNFSSNNLGDLCFFNDIGDSFQHNRAGNFFGDFFNGGNTIGDGAYDNIFADHFVGNSILDNFNNNNTSTFFAGNTIGSDFQYNTSQYTVLGVDFTLSPSPTHVYSSYTCILFGDENSTLKLSYVDGSGNFTVVDPDQ